MAVTRRDIVPAVILGLVLVVRLLVSPATSTAAFGQPTALGLAVLLASAALVTGLLVVRRRFPLPVLALVVIILLGWVVVGYPGPGAIAPMSLALYSVAVQRRLPVTLAAGTLAIVAVGGATGWLIGRGGDPGEAITSALILSLGAAVGVAVHNHHRALREAVARAEEQAHARENAVRSELTEQRMRLARDLHDGIAHHMAVVSVQAAAADRLVERDPARARQSLTLVRSAAQTVLDELAGALDLLRGQGPQAPTAPVDGPSLAGLPALFDGARASGQSVEAELRVDGATEDARGAVAYRLVQEALTNAGRHAPGAPVRVSVELIAAGDLLVQVSNAAPARHATSRPPGTGSGLIGMRERVRAVGGTLVAGPDEHGGFTVRAELPAPESGDEPGGLA